MLAYLQNKEKAPGLGLNEQREAGQTGSGSQSTQALWVQAWEHYVSQAGQGTEEKKGECTQQPSGGFPGDSEPGDKDPGIKPGRSFISMKEF